MTKSEIIVKLESMEIDYPTDATKADLEVLLSKNSETVATVSGNLSEIISPEKWNATSTRPSFFLKTDNFDTLSVVSRKDTANSPTTNVYAYTLSTGEDNIVRYAHEDILKDLAKEAGAFVMDGDGFRIDYNQLFMESKAGNLSIH